VSDPPPRLVWPGGRQADTIAIGTSISSAGIAGYGMAFGKLRQGDDIGPVEDLPTPARLT